MGHKLNQARNKQRIRQNRTSYKAFTLCVLQNVQIYANTSLFYPLIQFNHEKDMNNLLSFKDPQSSRVMIMRLIVVLSRNNGQLFISL